MNAHEYSVLAFYPTTRGYAFALFEREAKPVDWGVKDIRGPNRDKNAQTLAGLESILDRFHPDAVVIEDHTEHGSRRSARIRRLYRSIPHLLATRAIDVHRYGKREIRRCFASVGASSKYEIAEAVARQIPDFSHQLPRKRKIWESERSVMGLFAAGALALTLYGDSR